MNSTALLILFGLQEAIKLAPALEAELVALFSKGPPTAEDWQALRGRLAGQTYESFVPATALAPEAPAPAPAVDLMALEPITDEEAAALKATLAKMAPALASHHDYVPPAEAASGA